MEHGVWKPYFDPEYENLSLRINPPRVHVDNSSCPNCTVIKVDRVNKPGTLLEVVQVLCDLDLTINKAYISSDGGWFLDVFHVVNQQGTKIFDKRVIESIEMALGPKSIARGRHGKEQMPNMMVGRHPVTSDHTAIELIGFDRPGLLSEIFAILHGLHCNVLAVEGWAHGDRLACVVYVDDEATSGAINDPTRLGRMEKKLRHVLGVSKGGDISTNGSARTAFSVGAVNVDRRLHQLMYSDEDDDVEEEEEQERVEKEEDGGRSEPTVTIDHCPDKGYSVINIRCKDRPKLVLDILCTLTDFNYVACHASVKVNDSYAVQEYYIRSLEGSTIMSKAEGNRVARCLQSAILRRAYEGIRLELCARDRAGLLSDYTRLLREHGLSIVRAVVIAVSEQARSVFYIRNASGDQVDMRTIEALQKEIGHNVKFIVKKFPTNVATSTSASSTAFSFYSFLKWLL